jgi:transcriptional regulator with XRE-family HTH domain
MSTDEKTFASLFEQAEQFSDYWRQMATLDFAEGLSRLMQEAGITRAELARRMGTSQAYITQVLRADGNFTLETMTRFAMAFDHRVSIHLAPKHSLTAWEDTPYTSRHELDEHSTQAPGIRLTTGS